MATTAEPNPRLDQYYARPHTLAKVSRRRRMNLVITGESSPTVILAGGHGCTTLSWALVQIGLGLSARTVSFDQAGMGFSDPGPLPVTGSAIVEDLRAALKSADIPPPYVLVGLSLGGLYMRLFAFKYPQEVVGLVMVDSSSEHQHRQFFGENSPHLAALRRAQLRRLTRLGQLAREGALVPGVPEYDALVRTAAIPMPLTPAVEAARNNQLASAVRWRGSWRLGSDASSTRLFQGAFAKAKAVRLSLSEFRFKLCGARMAERGQSSVPPSPTKERDCRHRHR